VDIFPLAQLRLDFLVRGSLVPYQTKDCIVRVVGELLEELELKVR
jgi:predicted ATP-grasp superfamily ATP-dependent carboligase